MADENLNSENLNTDVSANEVIIIIIIISVYFGYSDNKWSEIKIDKNRAVYLFAQSLHLSRNMKQILKMKTKVLALKENTRQYKNTIILSSG